MEEIWKPIEGYEGLYEISSLGRVRSLHYNKVLILKQQFTHKGYLQVKLYKNGNKSTLSVHRLVAIAFIPNPNNFPEVNHINEFAKHDNRIENLEWCTSKYNSNYGTRKLRHSISTGKIVIATNKTTGEVLEFHSSRECARKLNVSKSSVQNCCRNGVMSKSNYIFKYKNNS